MYGLKTDIYMYDLKIDIYMHGLKTDIYMYAFSDVNECEQKPHICSKNQHEMCVNNIGSHLCTLSQPVGSRVYLGHNNIRYEIRVRATTILV